MSVSDDRISADMHATGWHLIGDANPPVARFHVMGERSSGTNYIQWALRETTALKDVDRDRLRGNPAAKRLSKWLGVTIKEPSIGHYGWKHGIPTFPGIGRSDLLLVCFRGLFDWLVSMYAKPWHLNDALLSLSFSDFIRAEWDSRIDRPLRYFDLPNAPEYEGVPLRLDRHPITGRKFGSILELRSVKTQAYLGLAYLGGNVALIRHDAFVADSDRCLKDLSQSYGFRLRPRSATTGRRMGSEWKYDGQARYEEARRGIETERDYILETADLETERRVGFQY